MSGSTTGIDSDTMKSGMDAIMDKQNANELSMYQFSSNASFQQSLASTYGGLAMDAAKNKPQV